MFVLQDLKKWWFNPLDEIPFGSVGLAPFPVEIWEHIFSLIDDPIQYSVNGVQTYQYFFSEEEESKIWDLNAIPNYSVPHTRLSIILTCRSWYHLGLPNLWSHLLLKGTTPNRDTSRIYDILQRKARLGSYVARLSIILPRLNGPILLSAILRILPFLTNLSTVYCPVRLLKKFPSSFRENVAVIRALPLGTEWGPSRVSTISMHDAFWRHCQTLSLMTPLDDPINFAAQEVHVVFPNLINLRLCAVEPRVLYWILTAWHLPALKNFSMTGPKDLETVYLFTSAVFTQLLERIKHTLEKAQLPAIFLYSHAAENAVEFPQLTELHILNLYDMGETVLQTFYPIIDTPKLRRLTFYAYSDQQLQENYWGRINMVTASLRRLYPPPLFPSVKEIEIIATRGEWVSPGQYKPYELVARIEDIQALVSHGFTVRVVSGTKGAVETFPAGEWTALREKVGWSARLVIKS